MKLYRNCTPFLALLYFVLCPAPCSNNQEISLLPVYSSVDSAIRYKRLFCLTVTKVSCYPLPEAVPPLTPTTNGLLPRVRPGLSAGLDKPRELGRGQDKDRGLGISSSRNFESIRMAIA